jgi:hypothetical protein
VTGTTSAAASTEQQQRPPPRPGLALGALALVGLLSWRLAPAFGDRQAALLVLGAALGVTLVHSHFGFAAPFRGLVTGGGARTARPHLLLLAAASLLFAPILAQGWGFGVRPLAFLFPAGPAVAAGAFLFGVGMPFGSACAAGLLYDVGAGYVVLLLTLAGFAAGAVLGAWQWAFWTQVLPAPPPLSLARTGLGFGGAGLVQGALLGLALLATTRAALGGQPPPARARPPAWSAARVIRGPWPTWLGAVLLAALDALVLLVRGRPWSTTAAFALGGGHLLAALGVPVASSAYWAGRAASLHAPLLANPVVVLDLGLALGALLASALAGSFALRRPVAWRTALGAVLGGLLMGYGGLIADGCTIGGYLGGIASSSLHGWLWAAAALGGTAVGERLVRRFGLTPLQANLTEW